MGVFDEQADDIITIHASNWEPHEECVARTVVKVSDFEWVQSQLVLIKQSSQTKRRGAFQKDVGLDIQAQTGAADRLWVFRMLKSWTFTRGGQPVPLSLEAVRQLPQSVLNYIYNEIQERQPKEEGEEKAEPRSTDGEEEEGSLFFDDASDSIDGEMSNPDEGLSGEHGARNYLTK
jgi:hypothetical protein